MDVGSVGGLDTILGGKDKFQKKIGKKVMPIVDFEQGYQAAQDAGVPYTGDIPPGYPKGQEVEAYNLKMREKNAMPIPGEGEKAAQKKRLRSRKQQLGRARTILSEGDGGVGL